MCSQSLFTFGAQGVSVRCMAKDRRRANRSDQPDLRLKWRFLRKILQSDAQEELLLASVVLWPHFVPLNKWGWLALSVRAWGTCSQGLCGLLLSRWALNTERTEQAVLEASSLSRQELMGRATGKMCP